MLKIATSSGLLRTIVLAAVAAIILPTASAAGRAATPSTCAAMVQQWDKNYSFEEVTSCKPWRKQKADALYATMRRCEIRTHEDVGECAAEDAAYSQFLTVTTAIENPPLGFSPHKVFAAAPPTEPTVSSAERERSDARRRAKRRQEIIDSFGPPAPVPGQAKDQ